MITAAVTASVAFVLSLFGIKPSVTTLLGIALVVKIAVVATGVLFGSTWLRRREARQAAAAPQPPGGEPPVPPPPPAPPTAL